jgi:hypothetical protein
MFGDFDWIIFIFSGCEMAVFCTYNIDWEEIAEEKAQKRLDFSG